ncbi:MAG: exopolysaccharide biosynthesis polyprenyl glycosylphosphotransferase, partial [Bdellovibrionales bacterium]|nr:exopolysaccharide biosynthesis polyprenyl glycosylphosphotransferase [Bdellovibrionales bacterium]
MLKENWRSIARIERVADNLIIVLAFFISYFGRDSLYYWNRVFGWKLSFVGPKLAPVNEYLVVLLVALPVYNILLNLFGAYSSMRLSSSLRLLRITGASSLAAFLFITSFLFTFKIDLSRTFVGLFCVIICLALTAERYVVLNCLRFWRRRGRNFRNVIVCGIGAQALDFAKELLARPELGIRLVGFGVLRPTPNDEIVRFANENPHLPKVFFRGCQELEIGLKEMAVDEVIFTDVIHCMDAVEESVIICSEQGVRTTLAADLFSIGMVKSEVSFFGSMPLIHYHTPPGDHWELALKRGLDIVLSLVFMVLLLPVFIVVAVAVRISSSGPILFKQKRVGLNGRLFSLYKFRSMYSDAEERLEDLKAHNEMSGPVFKMKNDPRITPVGRLLRRFSLDELPQLWNVLRGDMSLVGPR